VGDERFTIASMTGSTAPKEVKVSELWWRIWLLAIVWVVAVLNRSWWWVLAIVASVAFAFVVSSWWKDYRAYRAWVRWDEAGGPDAGPSGPAAR
jgi:hypothetical protein